MIPSKSGNANRTARAAALAALLAIGCAIALIVAGRASAGELVFKGCVSDDGTPRVPHGKSCTAIRKGAFSSLNALALSPEGRSLYAGAGVECLGNDDYRCYATAAVDRFKRDSKTGALDYRNCLTAATEVQAGCAELPAATEHAFGAPLGDISSMVVSPEGNSLYVASSDPQCYFSDSEDQDVCVGSDALARFDRDPDTGAITYADCITGDRRSGPTGSGACMEIPTATDDGFGSGLDFLESVAISDDGRSLYAAAARSLARFDRNPLTGALVYRGCITGEKELGPSGSGACTEIPSATQTGDRSGLLGLGSIVLSDDGTSLYGVTSDDVVRFDRDPDTGALTYRGCITGDKRLGPSGSGACSEIPSAAKRQGARSGLGYPTTLALGANGRSLYVGAVYSDAIARFDRDPDSGAITFVGCLTGDTKVGPSGSGACHQIRSAARNGGGGLPWPYSMALGAGGRSLFVAYGSTIGRVRVKPATGALHYAGCLTGAKGSELCREIRTAGKYRGSGLRGISALAATGKTLYAAAQDDRDVATLAIAPQTKIRKAKIHRHRAVFRFEASSASKFKCKLKGDGVPKHVRRWRRCGSHGFRHKGRQGYRGLQGGTKVFRVRATDRAHTTDPTPAKKRCRVQ